MVFALLSLGLEPAHPVLGVVLTDSSRALDGLSAVSRWEAALTQLHSYKQLLYV